MDNFETTAFLMIHGNRKLPMPRPDGLSRKDALPYSLRLKPLSFQIKMFSYIAFRIENFKLLICFGLFYTPFNVPALYGTARSLP